MTHPPKDKKQRPAPVYRFEPQAAAPKPPRTNHADFVRQIVESAERDRLRYEQEKQKA